MEEFNSVSIVAKVLPMKPRKRATRTILKVGQSDPFLSRVRCFGIDNIPSMVLVIYMMAIVIALWLS